jgi:predicted transcriptional regulator of viral defense system
MAREDVLPVLLEAASEQGGYVTARQAARLGIERSRLARLTETEDLRRVRWGVYAMRHAHHRLEDEIAAWLSIDRERLPWERGDEPVAVLSHASAAGLQDLGTLIPGYPALTVPPERRSATRGKDLDLHVAPLAAEDWTWLRSEEVRLPATTPARTIVDLILSGEELGYIERAVSEGLTSRRLTPQDLVETAERRKKRTGALAQRVRRLLEAAAA